MEKNKDLILINEKSLDEVVGSIEYSLTVFKEEVPHIRKLIVEAREVTKSLEKISVIKNKLDRTIHDFNDDIVAKLKTGSVDEILVVLNEIGDRVERLGDRLTNQYQLVLDLHQKELIKIVEENVKMSDEFKRDLFSMMVDKVNELSISRIEKAIQAEIKRRLGNFKFEEMQSLIQVSEMEKHLKHRIKIYDDNFMKMEEHTMKIKKMIEWNQEQSSIIHITYIVGALGLGLAIGYTKFFYMFG